MLEVSTVAAGALALLVAIVLYHYLGSEYLGADENRKWNQVRRTILVPGHRVVKENTGLWGTVKGKEDAEHVGRADGTSHSIASLLEEKGYEQSVLSGLTFRPGTANPRKDDIQYEDGSMAYRESKSDLLPDVFAIRQTHAYWFENDDGTVEIYAHEEYNSLNPITAWLHYIGQGKNQEKGAEKVRDDLTEAGVKW